MATVGLNAANFGGFKIVYGNRIVEALKRHEGQWNQMQTIQGNTDQYRFFLELQGVTQLGNTVEGANFRTPNAPVVLQPFVGYKVFECPIELTDVVFALAKGDRGSIRSATQHLIKSALGQSMRYREIMHYLDGTGVVGVLGGTVTAGTTTMTVGAYDATAGRSTDRTGIQQGVWPGAVYDVYSAAGAFIGEVTVASQSDPSGATGIFTLAAPGFPAGVSVGDLLVWKGSYGIAYDGLNNLVDNDVSGTFQGITFSSNPLANAWVSTVSAAGGTPRTLTPSLFIRALQGIFGATGNSGDSNFDAGMTAAGLQVLANPALAEQITGLYQVTTAAANSAATSASPNLVRGTPETKKWGNGSLSLATPFGDLTVKLKNNCPNSQCFGVDYSQIKFVESMPLDWRPGLDRMFNPSQIGAVRTAQLYEVGIPIIEDRRTSFKISDLTVVNTNTGN